MGDQIIIGVYRAFKTSKCNGSRGAKRPFWIYRVSTDGHFSRVRCTLFEAIAARRHVRPVRVWNCTCGFKSRIAGDPEGCPLCGNKLSLSPRHRFTKNNNGATVQKET